MRQTRNLNIRPAKIDYSGIIFWSCAFVLFFYALGYRDLWAAEGRWAEITREMLLTGDFFHPTINGLPYFDKPLLTYWLIVAVYYVTGELNEWTIRIPSAVSGLLALWAVTGLGRRLWSKEAGRTAGWILLTTYGVLFWSRTASADMANLAAAIIAVSWYWARRERLGFLTFVVFYLICFLGAHTKGLTAFVVPVLAVFPDVIREGRWRKLISFSHLLALAIGLVIYFAPFVYAATTGGQYTADGLALVFRENIQRYFKPFDHKEAFYVYLYYLPVLMAPWSPLFMVCVGKTFASYKRLDSRTRWLAEAIVLIFLLFTCSGSRRGYYILPILPFCAMLVSVCLTGQKEQSAPIRVAIRIQRWIFGLCALAAVLLACLWPLIQTHMGLPFIPGLSGAGLITGTLALLILLLFHLRPGIQPWRIMGVAPNLTSCIGSAVILLAGGFYIQQVDAGLSHCERPMGLELKKVLEGLPPERIACIGEIIPNIVFYLERSTPIQTLSNPQAVQNFIEADNAEKVLIVTPRGLGNIVDVLSAQIGQAPVFLGGSCSRKVKKDYMVAVWHIMGQKGR